MRMNTTREHFKNSTYLLALTDEAMGIELYHSACGTYAMGFSGKRQRPDFHYNFRGQERACEYVSKWLSDIDKRKAEKLERKQEAKAAAMTLKVGDVLMSMWGYEQTNVDFYEVVELVGKCSVRIREIAAMDEYHAEGMRGYVVPKPGAFIGEPMLKRVSSTGRVRLTSFSGASLLEPVAEVGGVKIYPPTAYTSYA